MVKEASKIIEQFVDLLMPELTPYEGSLYLFLLRHSFLKNNTLTLRIGERTIANKFVRGVRGDRVNFNHISRVLKELEKKGCIKVGDANRTGTLYEIILPENIRFIAEKLAIGETKEEADCFTNNKYRKKLFERDK